MEIIKTEIEGVVILKPKVFGDDRGYFFESFREDFIYENVCKNKFIQDNESSSKYGVIRGLHFQKPPHAQSKLVRVVKGKVLDVAVDIRKNSSTFGQYISVELSGENKKQLWIAPGMAHGFLALENDTIFSYKCTNLYNPTAEGGLLWNDKSLNIDWKLEENGIKDPIVSEKDAKNVSWQEFVG